MWGVYRWYRESRGLHGLRVLASKQFCVNQYGKDNGNFCPVSRDMEEKMETAESIAPVESGPDSQVISSMSLAISGCFSFSS